MKKLLIALCTGLGLSFAAQAAQAPDEVIRNAVDTLQSDIGANKAKYQTDKSAFYKMVDTKIVSYIDTRAIVRRILGPAARTATPEQLTRFEAAFKNNVLRSYGDLMLQYATDVKADVKPAKMAPDAKVATVNTIVNRKDGPPVPVNFVMKLGDDGTWKIQDITAEGISLPMSIGAQLSPQVRARGIDAVAADLEAGKLQVQPPDSSKK